MGISKSHEGPQGDREDINPRVLSTALHRRVFEESTQNLNSVIHQIAELFDQTLSLVGTEKFDINLRAIDTHLSYLGEKYRDTKEQREYIKTLKTAIKYLDSLE